MSTKGQSKSEPPRVRVGNGRWNTLVSSESMVSPQSVSESPYEPPSGWNVRESLVECNLANEHTTSNDDANSSRSPDNPNRWILSSSDLPLSKCQMEPDDAASTISSCSSDLHPRVINITLKQIISRSLISNTPNIIPKNRKREIVDAQTEMNRKSINGNTNNRGSPTSKQNFVNGIPRRGSQPNVISQTDFGNHDELSVRRNHEKLTPPKSPESPPSALSSLPSPMTIPDSPRNFPHLAKVTRFPGSIPESPEAMESRKKARQQQITELVLSSWPQMRLPTAKHLVTYLSPQDLERRKMFSPLTIGVTTVRGGKQMVWSATVTKTKHVAIDNCQKPMMVTSICDPREYLVKHCPTYQNPPLDEQSPDSEWTEKFVLTKVLPKLAKEVSIVQQQPGLLLTVKEVKMRGLEEEKIFECKYCQENDRETGFDYKGIMRHLQGKHSKIKVVVEEDHIKIDLKKYILAFYKNLPPRIIR